jgi:aryl-alcohol dehydrogenase-like predicted oxidoreductase
LRTTRELGITFVAYSPLGRGLLTGKIEDPASLADNDTRKRHPRFAADNITHNVDLVHRVEGIAKRKNCTPGQLALAWLLAQGEDIIPIPGTKRKARLLENIGALRVSLSGADIAEISSAVPPGAAAGSRYPEGQMKSVYL